MHFLVDFFDTVTESEIADYFSNCGATVLRQFDNFKKVYHVDCAVTPPNNSIVEFIVNDDNSTIELLSTVINSNVNWGQIATDGSLPMMTIPNDDQNWWKFYTFIEPDLESTEYVTNRRGNKATVYVLDSGIEIGHPEFSEADVQNLWSFTGDFTDTRGHGTAIASVIAGKTCGVTNATVKSVKIFDENVPTKQSDMLKALDAIYNDSIINLQNNPENTLDRHSIVNCSWAISKNAYIEDKMRTMLTANIFFVAAAGNNGSPISDVTPASIREIATVGSYNNNLLPSDFSNYTGGSAISFTAGATNYGVLDGWAPGEQIWAAGLNGTYGYVAGTSIAAAIHSAILAYNVSVDGVSTYIWDDLEMLYDPCFTRDGILDLSNPKYLNSKNRITTALDRSPPNNGPTYSETAVCRSGQFFAALVFNPSFVKKLEYDVDLPGSIHIYSSGVIQGTAPEISGRYQTFTVPMRLTKTDDSVIEFDYKIHVIAIDFDTGYEVTGDIELDIVLSATITCFSQNPTRCIGNINICATVCPSPPNLFCQANTTITCGPAKGASLIDCFCRPAPAPSDVVLKENVSTIDNALDKLKQINGVYFDWKQSFIEELKNNGSFVRKRETGVIANEVEKVLPEVIVTQENGLRYVEYDKMAGLIIEAIKELDVKLENIKKHLNI